MTMGIMILSTLVVLPVWTLFLKPCAQNMKEEHGDLFKTKILFIQILLSLTSIKKLQAAYQGLPKSLYCF